MVLQGRAWKFGRDIDTDVIIPIKYCNITDQKEMARHCMEGIDPDFVSKIKPGDMIVANENFGCGSSREPAPISIKLAGISCVIAKSFARIFYRNSFNVGLPLLISPEACEHIKQGDKLEVNINNGKIHEFTQDISFYAKPIPPFMQQLIRDGGLLNHIARELNKNSL
jgi:3-isopropylmalate dehydratase small subunit